MHVPMLGTRRVVVRHSCNANARRIQQANINHDEDRVPRCPECALAPYDPDEEMMCRSCAEHWSVVAEIDDARDRTRPDPSDAYKIARGG